MKNIFKEKKYALGLVMLIIIPLVIGMRLFMEHFLFRTGEDIKSIIFSTILIVLIIYIVLLRLEKKRKNRKGKNSNK